jgi:ankyrin repeat protein
MAAARKGYDAEHVEIVKILLAHGANVNATDPLGSSAVRLAQRKGLSKMVNLLESHGGRYLGA